MNTDTSSTMTASTSGSNNNITGGSIFDAAQTRWLSVEEIITLLSDAHESDQYETIYGVPNPNALLRLSTSPPDSPPTSGTLFLYNRIAVRNYKVDRHDWVRKRSNPSKIREDHVKLRYKGQYRVGGNYVHSADVDTLHRRVYRLLETDEEKAAGGRAGKALVLVHYLDTSEAARITAAKNGGSTSRPSRASASSRSTRNTGKRTRDASGGDNMVARDEKRTHTANSYAEAMGYYDDGASDPSYYYGHQQQTQTVAWSPYKNSGAALSAAMSYHGRSASSEAAHLDRINFDWGSMESDAALASGLDQLLEAGVKQSHDKQASGAPGPNSQEKNSQGNNKPDGYYYEA